MLEVQLEWVACLKSQISFTCDFRCKDFDFFQTAPQGPRSAFLVVRVDGLITHTVTHLRLVTVEPG